MEVFDPQNPTATELRIMNMKWNKKRSEMAYLCANGATIQEAGKEVGYSHGSVVSIAKWPAFNERVRILKTQIDATFVQKCADKSVVAADAFRVFAPEAAAFLIDLVRDEKEKTKTRAEAARWILTATGDMKSDAATQSTTFILDDSVSEAMKRLGVMRDVPEVKTFESDGLPGEKRF